MKDIRSSWTTIDRAGYLRQVILQIPITLFEQDIFFFVTADLDWSLYKTLIITRVLKTSIGRVNKKILHITLFEKNYRSWNPFSAFAWNQEIKQLLSRPFFSIFKNERVIQLTYLECSTPYRPSRASNTTKPTGTNNIEQRTPPKTVVTDLRDEARKKKKKSGTLISPNKYSEKPFPDGRR